nr:odorant binding protein 16 [Pachyrhinus yasumatsui]
MNCLFAVFACVLFASALALSDADKEKFKETIKKIDEAHQHCNKDASTHVDEEAVRKMTRENGPEPEKLGAHTLCVTKQLNWQHADGSVNEEYLRPRIKAALVDRPDAEEIVTKCLEPQDTPEKTAKHIFGCFMKHTPRPNGTRPRDHEHHEKNV